MGIMEVIFYKYRHEREICIKAGGPAMPRGGEANGRVANVREQWVT